MPTLPVLCWNIRDLTAANLGWREDKICSLINNSGASVVFILEVLSGAAAICASLIDKLNGYGTDVWHAVWTNVGSEGQRTEYGVALVRSTSKETLSINDYGFYDREDAYGLATKLVPVSATSANARTNGPQAVGNRVPMYLNLTVQRGFVADRAYSVAAWHAPNPGNNPSEYFQTYEKALIKSGVGVLVGDFNYESGSELSVTSIRATSLGGRFYDRAYILDSEAYSLGDVKNLGSREATDHAAIMTWVQLIG